MTASTLENKQEIMIENGRKCRIWNNLIPVTIVKRKQKNNNNWKLKMNILKNIASQNHQRWLKMKYEQGLLIVDSKILRKIFTKEPEILNRNNTMDRKFFLKN